MINTSKAAIEASIATQKELQRKSEEDNQKSFGKVAADVQTIKENVLAPLQAKNV